MVKISLSEDALNKAEPLSCALYRRRLHAERQDLIRQWDEAMEAMRNRDNAIAIAGEQFAATRQAIKLRKGELDAQVGSEGGTRVCSASVGRSLG